MYTAKTTRAGVPQRDHDQQPLLLSVPQAARLLGIGTTLCWEMVHSGQLSSIRLGRRVLVSRVVVERLAQAEEAPIRQMH